MSHFLSFAFIDSRSLECNGSAVMVTQSLLLNYQQRSDCWSLESSSVQCDCRLRYQTARSAGRLPV